VVREHRVPAARACAPGDAIGEPVEVEADQPRVARERKEIEAGVVEAITVGAGAESVGIPVVIEEQADPGDPGALGLGGA